MMPNRARRHHHHVEQRNNAHTYMRSLRGEETNTLFITYTMVQGTVDPSTPGVYNNPSTVVFTFNGTSCADHFIEYFHFQKATSEIVEPELIRRVARWIIEDFRRQRRLLPDYVIVLRDQVRDEMQPVVEDLEFEAFKSSLAEYAESTEGATDWLPRYAFGLAPWRPEHTEPLVYLFRNDDNIFSAYEEFQNLIVNMFITIRVRNFRFSVLEPIWAAENTAKLWTKLFPGFASLMETRNRGFSRLDGSNQYDWVAISLQFHTETIEV